MGLLLLFVAAIGLFFSGIIFYSDLQNHSKIKHLSGIFLLVISCFALAFAPIVREKEMRNRENNKIVQKAMGETKYKIIRQEDNVFTLLTENDQVIYATIGEKQVSLSADKSEEKKEQK